MNNPQDNTGPCSLDELSQIKLFVPPNLYSAFHRCVWIRVNETGKNQLEIMQEMVEEFLKKHQC
ncbi:hypothetical protein [Desulfogranum japonicum]|uniref:hypothetical protein n=1 Tax=Desulfogranum japonicum TaxID=231447 RepID=UPI00040C4285|nr:hypothetical protein [Desulfogranum japonicum]